MGAFYNQDISDIKRKQMELLASQIKKPEVVTKHPKKSRSKPHVTPMRKMLKTVETANIIDENLELEKHLEGRVSPGEKMLGTSAAHSLQEYVEQ